MPALEASGRSPQLPRRSRLKVAIAALCLALIAQDAAAQPSAPTITDEFNARATERARRGLAKPFDLPDFAQPAPGPSEPMFRLEKVLLTGAHVVSKEQLGQSYRAFLGRKVSQANLVEITNAIGEIYKRHGYALSRAFVPPQDVQDGRVAIRVVEGFIESVEVQGEGSDWFIPRGMVDGITSEKPLRLATLERHLLLVGDLPGVRIVDAALKENGTGSGRFRLTIRAEFRRAVATLDLDNRGSRHTGPWQSFNSLALGSVFRSGDLAGLNVATVPVAPEQLTYVGGVYEMPLGINGARLGVRAAYSTSSPGGPRGLINVQTQSYDTSIYGSIAPVRTRDFSLRLTSALSVREVEETNIWGVYYQDHIRAGSLAADIQAKDPLNGFNVLSLTYRAGIGGLGASDRAFISSRPDAESDFHKGVVTYSRHQPLIGAFSFVVAAGGQVTSAPMLKSEAFYYGGSAFGRAYAPGSLLGDSGLVGLAELRFDQTVDRPWLKSYQLYVFRDSGALWTRGAEIQRVSSYGGGVRWRIDEDMRAGFEVALPGDSATFVPIEQTPHFYVSLSRTFKGCAQFWCF